MVLSAGFNSFDCLFSDHAVLTGLCYDIDVGLSCHCPDFNLKIYRRTLDKKKLIIQDGISTPRGAKNLLHQLVK